MLRSACADPHITEHTLRAKTEASVVVAWKLPDVTDAEAGAA
jgi:hypothetical protein